jgi:hypothetical protein
MKTCTTGAKYKIFKYWYNLATPTLCESILSFFFPKNNVESFDDSINIYSKDVIFESNTLGIFGKVDLTSLLYPKPIGCKLENCDRNVIISNNQFYNLHIPVSNSLQAVQNQLKTNFTVTNNTFVCNDLDDFKRTIDKNSKEDFYSMLLNTDYGNICMISSGANSIDQCREIFVCVLLLAAVLVFRSL